MKFVKALLKIILREKLITAIFILGLFLRLLGTFPGYPLTHPDEPTIQTSSVRMVFELNFRPIAYYYGQLLPLLYAISYILIFIPLTTVFMLPANINILNKGFVEYIYFIYKSLTKSLPLHEQGFWSINYWARYDGAIISAFIVIIAYILGKRLYNRQIGLIATFLIAINYRHVLSSRLILADAPAAFFGLLAVFLSSNLLQNSSIRNYIVSGIGLALSLSVKYFVYVIPTFLLCHLLTTLKNAPISIPKLVVNYLNYKFFITLIVCGILFIAINPYFLLAPDEASYYWAANSARYGLRLSPEVLQSFNLSYYSLYYLYYYGLGPILSILTLVGFIWSIIRYPKSTLIISSAAIPYIYTFLVISGTGLVRNYSAIIPFVLFFPSAFIYDSTKLIFNLLKKTTEYKFGMKSNYFLNLQKVFLILIILSAGYQSIYHSIISGFYLSKEQNMISLYRWMDNYLPEGSEILGPSGVFYPAGKNLSATKLTIEGNNITSLEEIYDKKFKWIILSWIPADISENLLLNKDITRKVFFNKILFDDLAYNNYSSLIFNELSDYRIAEFAKPFTQDPPFMIISFPDFWKLTADHIVTKFDFNNSSTLEEWNYKYYVNNSYSYNFSPNKGIENSGAIDINQTTPHCTSIYVQLLSPKITIYPSKWYTLSVMGKRKANQLYERIRNGFFRINFFDAKDNLIKTYVSKTLSASDFWQKLYASGMSPENSTYAEIVFQIDSCLENEQYTIDDVNLFEAEQNPNINLQLYPFYMKKPSDGFSWMPQL